MRLIFTSICMYGCVVCVCVYLFFIFNILKAPGHYRPENCKIDNSPAFTFGLKVAPKPGKSYGRNLQFINAYYEK